jgi:hypothetical protein
MNRLQLLLAIALLWLQPLQSFAAEQLEIKNGDFKQWEKELPAEWAIEIGARSGTAKPSQLQPLEDGGVELSGVAGTGEWKSLAQKIAVPAGAALRLRFEARTAELQREGRQFDNCYIGLAVFDAAGKRLALHFRDLFENDWAPGQLAVKLPDSAASVQVQIFLSKSGKLQVRNVRLERLDPIDSFDVLVDELDRYYSFFDLKKLNWRERAAKYQDAGRRAANDEEFVAAVKPLLAELKDLHVGIELPGGRHVPTFVSAVDRNFDARAIAAELRGVKQIGRMGFIGRTAEGFGYLAIGTLAADAKATAEMLAAFDSLLDAKGLIIDLRPNAGGSELVAQQFISRLIDKSLEYASNQFRGGADYDNLVTRGTRQIAPGKGKAYEGRVVGLIGPGCVSSGEGFALMVAALPKGKLIGQPTRGASGNPQPVLLPNGVKVTYSTWVPLQLDGEPFEGVGIAPDVRIDDDPRGLKGLQAAIEALSEGVDKPE